MKGLAAQLASTLRLHFRNRMALIYGYLFPTIFLIAFWVLYRYDQVPLVRHVGELLTVTVLGGACFGLPTTMVSERERGVWRRYRLTPISIGAIVASTVAARYVLVVLAGLLQLALAMAVGMPMPQHPLELAIAFTFVAFAFLGMGLVIAMLADNVPAVQALGQCIFLPMLIIGGVAVPLASLPDWAQHVSAFFPGRYAVQALQSTVTTAGIGTARFSLLALTLIGLAGCAAGAVMFRWDAGERFSRRRGRSGVLVALAAWAAVGVLAETRGSIGAPASGRATAQGGSEQPPSAAASGETAPAVTPAPVTDGTLSPTRSGRALTIHATAAEQEAARGRSASGAGRETSPASAPPPSAPAPASAPEPAPASPPPGNTPAGPALPASWQAVTPADIDREIVFTRLPPDEGVVTPIATSDEQPETDVADEVELLKSLLPTWPPAKVADPVQRVRNYLYVMAVPDIFQMQTERFIPPVVFDRLEQEFPKNDLIKILFWIALTPYEGDDKAVDQMQPFGIQNGPPDANELRNRSAIYAVKLLGRLTGKRPGK